MAKAKQSRNNRQLKSAPGSLELRLLLAFLIPILGGVLLNQIATGLPSSRTGQASLFAGIGIASWFLGLRWYGLAGLGLRGKRPLFAGIGFATLGWVAFLIARFYFVGIAEYVNGAGAAFMFFLMFEAFAIQVWTFGLLFRVISEWRGPLTAAISSGIIFGAAASTLFQEAFINSWDALIYFIMWGIFYGIIRLRTGSLLGMVIIQALQSFTGWLVMLPHPEPAPAELRPFYLITAAAYLIFIWRLWPKVEDDYRV
jgi:hypothetical protein